jgi:hypothetical protein
MSPLATSSDVITSDRVEDTSVYDPNGDKLGAIDHLVIGRPRAPRGALLYRPPRLRPQAGCLWTRRRRSPGERSSSLNCSSCARR